MGTGRNIITTIGTMEGPGEPIRIIPPYNSITDGRYILTGTSNPQSLSGGLYFTGTLFFPSTNVPSHIVAVNSGLILSSSLGSVIAFSASEDFVNNDLSYHIRAVNSDLILSSSSTSQITLSGNLNVLGNPTGQVLVQTSTNTTGNTKLTLLNNGNQTWQMVASRSLNALVLNNGTTNNGLQISGNGTNSLITLYGIGGTNLTWVGSGSILNLVSGSLGINVSPTGSYPLDVEGVMGNTVAKFGDNLGMYMIESFPNIAFNAYYNNGWKYGKGSSGNYGSTIQLSPSLGQIQFLLSNASGSVDAAATMNTPVIISGSNPVFSITTQDAGATSNSALSIKNSSSPASTLNFYTQLSNNAYNPLVVTNDVAIIFSSGTAATGSLVIAPSGSNAWGIRINGNNGTIGINQALPLFPLDIGGGNAGLAGGGVHLLKVGGGGAGTYIGAGDSGIGFNTYFSGSWRYGVGSTTQYGMSFDFNSAANVLVLNAGTAGGSSGNTITGFASAMFVSGSASNGCSVGIGQTPGVGQQLDLSTDHARKLTTTTWTTGCDERLKEDIQIADYNMCLSGVMAIDLKYFKWKDLDRLSSVRDRHQLGFVAQTISGTFPKSVYTNNEYGYDDYLSLNVDQIYKNMYGAVRKLIEENNTLKQRLSNLETLLSATF